MKTLANGEYSTLKKWREIAENIGPKAVEFIDHHINNSPLGEEDEVVADEDDLLSVLIGIQLGLAEWKTDEKPNSPKLN